MPYKDKAKELAYKKKWNKDFYHANIDSEKHRIRARKKRIIEWLSQYRSTCSCRLCGENSPVCLDFHHKDEANKDRSLSEAVRNRGWGIKRIEEEISKCIVLCSNCHRKLHAGIISLTK